MPQKDTSSLKQKIINYIQSKGPSLPVHIAKEIGQSMLFTSAFLSELLSEDRLKVSKLKIGSSPLYYIKGQEALLENFSRHLNHKEREAYELLKQKKILKDSNQEPAIRVALRSIKDFAESFEREGNLYWKYKHSDVEEESVLHKEPLQKESEEEKDLNDNNSSKEEENKKNYSSEEKEKTQEDGSKVSTSSSLPKESQTKEKSTSEEESSKKKSSTSSSSSSQNKKKKTTKKKSSKKSNKFFNQVKEHLQNQGMEISDIIDFSSKDLVLKVNSSEEEKTIVAYNKKKIKQEDLLNAHKKAQDSEYTILCLGEPLKKLEKAINAVRKLSKIEKIK